ncbi:hypothetical protein MM59RIKEN_26810 [Pusillibacter faecalis]|uniref:Glycine-rich domain-containing protein n=1 Tax=Pusillibacter faecalis TaxID=2714358 RepID=A0A810QH64_9FIRM|nr:hypothetical protein [Pusillibacter faecalis]BCK85362.1 hypothetical protein MM59RIKEN_26810 [Pusillibacter faecalis]
MDFTPLEKDMNIISALDDEPNDVGGLTATELKAKFDEGGNAIKDYLNNTVIPEVKVALGDKAGKDELQGLVLGQIPDGTITEDKLSEELKEQIGSMAPASDVFTKEETLSPETAALYELDDTAAPDDVFIILALGAGKYGYGITVKYPDGTPAAGLSVTGVTGRLGEAIITDENGYFLAVSENNKISFSIKSPYFDIANISNQAVNAAGVLTRQTVEFAYKTYEDYILLTTSQVMKFSRAYKLDLTAVGGGGGSTGVNTKSAFGAGGGGGYVETQLDIDVDTSDKLTVTIGAGGSIHYITNATTAGNPGGHTAVDKGSIRLVSAYGGTGSGVNNGVPFQGTGNGNGGVRSNSVVNPTNGTGFIFNDASLGLAGGGGGGGFLAGAGQTEMRGGTPNGANGGYVDTNNNTAYRAGSAGVGGGGGAGGSQQISTKADASPGGTGGVYIRFKSA